MNKILIAVDGTKASRAVLSTCHNLVRRPDSVVLLHVQRLEGRSLMTGMLGDAEMSTLKESMKGTDHKEELDRQAERILDFYRSELEDEGYAGIKTVIRAGHPAEEILKVADEEGVQLIIVGNSERSGLNRMILGSVAKEVRAGAKVPVLSAKRAVTCEEEYTWKDAYAAVTVTTAIVAGLFLVSMIIQRGWILH